MEKKILRLTLKKKFFDMIASGEKKEEYREMKRYWLIRLFDFNPPRWGTPKKFDVVEFKNGYSKNAPTMVVEFKGVDIGEPKPEWSDNWQGETFRIHLGEIISPKRPPK